MHETFGKNKISVPDNYVGIYTKLLQYESIIIGKEKFRT